MNELVKNCSIISFCMIWVSVHWAGFNSLVWCSVGSSFIKYDSLCRDVYCLIDIGICFPYWLSVFIFFYHLLWIGRFLAELTKQVFSDLVASKYQVLPYCPIHLYVYYILLYFQFWPLWAGDYALLSRGH